MGDIGDAAHHLLMQKISRLAIPLMVVVLAALSQPVHALPRATPLDLAQQHEALTGGGPFDPGVAAQRDARPR
ncbi:MAG TPA: hypothetical protein VGP48_08050 [Stellaceae bacterium]|jgi:hypothetical protein|nr:hypothetical protein [Stellaceae bacterium]